MNCRVTLILKCIGMLWLSMTHSNAQTAKGNQSMKPLELKIMSFNIQFGNDYWGESNLRTVLKIIQDEKPHLVALQGVDSVKVDGKVRHQLRQLALQSGMYYVYGETEKVADGSKGIGILTRFSPSKVQKFMLPDAPPNVRGRSTVSPRALLCAYVEYALGRGLRFCCSRIEYANGSERLLQAAFVNGLLNESIQPVILGIDLGAKPSEQPYNSFRKNWVDTGKGSTLATWVEGTPGDRFDYIFVLENVRMRVKDYKVIRRFPEVSDHFPIVSTIEIW